MQKVKTDLMTYLGRVIPAVYSQREIRPDVLENFEAQDSEDRPISKRKVRRSILTYFTQEIGLTHQKKKYCYLRFVGRSGEEYGVTFTFLPRSNLYAEFLSWRFRVTVSDFGKYDGPTIRLDEISDTALELLAVQRGKSPDHFR